MNIRYFAGLFDGEGWCRIDHYHNTNRNKPYHRFQLLVSLGMTHYPTIKQIQTSYGGSLFRSDYANKKRANNRISYTWKLVSQHACDLLIRMEPYLICKKEQARLCIEFQDHMNSIRTHYRKHRGNPPDIQDIHDYRFGVIEKLSELKQESFDIPKSRL